VACCVCIDWDVKCLVDCSTACAQPCAACFIYKDLLSCFSCIVCLIIQGFTCFPNCCNGYDWKCYRCYPALCSMCCSTCDLCKNDPSCIRRNGSSIVVLPIGKP
jgi:hypothetical protein